MATKNTYLEIPNVSFPSFLWRRCLISGDQVALVDNHNGSSLTFKEIYDQSRSCAAFLHQSGATVGDFIGLCAQGSPKFSIAMLGIMGCGATMAPCNPAFQKDEILKQFKISEPKMVVVDETTLKTMKSVQRELPSLETIFVMGESDEFITLDTMTKTARDMVLLESVEINASEDIAMLPYSSGTTGPSKSIMLTHRNLVASMIGDTANTKWLEQNTNVGYTNLPMYHGGGFGYILLALTTGMKLVIGREFKVEQMLKAIEKYKVTHLMTVPHEMIELANSEETAKYDTSSLLIITGGGGGMAPDILRRLETKFSVTLTPGYSMTETSGGISVVRDLKDPLSSVGTVNPTVELKIIDLMTSEECPVDQDGEIRIRGPQVTKGYLKNPTATANAIDNDGWLHTGDIGHLDEEKRLYVVGRLKEVIKYKGLQVLPTGIESVILKHPKVADVGVIGIPNEATGELPKAFVVKKHSSLTEQEIHAFVKVQLADCKQLRGGVEFVDVIPRNSPGKIQRKELKKMAGIEI